MMSTRSGKRIHRSFHENVVEQNMEHFVKSVRKTKNKRLKENSEELNDSSNQKKRSNYVAYPTDDESAAENRRVTRMLRRNTLKDLNTTVSNTDTDLIEVKSVRKTRRTKVIATEDDTSKHNPNTTELNKKKKNKIKKKSNKEDSLLKTIECQPPVIKKKSKKKKGKHSTSISNGVTEANAKNDNNTSMDSFHSAAGSPVEDNIINTEDNIPLMDDVPQDTQSIKSIISPTTNSLDLQIECSEGGVLNSGKKRKSSHRSNIDLCSDVHGNSYSSTKELLQRKSSVKDTNVNSFTRKSKLFNSTFEKSLNNTATDKIEYIFDNNEENSKQRISNVKSLTPNKRRSTINSTLLKTSENDKLSATFENKSMVNTTFEKIDSVNNTYDRPDSTVDIIDNVNSTFEKTDKVNSTYEKKDKINSTFEKSDKVNSTFEKKDKPNSTFEKKDKVNSTFDKIDVNSTFEKTDKLNSLFEKEDNNKNLDTTFDKDDKSQMNQTRNSLISSDSDSNVTYDKYPSRISITSDESKTENIVNTTPVLIESSMEDESNSLAEITPKKQTPLKREGTFTKESSNIPKENVTPLKYSLPSPGYTPFPLSKSSQKEKRSVLNVTRSVEKSRRSSMTEVAPRMTKVMFCSPVDIPVVTEKRKIIKSNLKGSNKSFVFDEEVRPARRKRSYTHNDAEDARAKRKRLADDMQQSVDRLSRPRTSSATVKSSQPPTPRRSPPKSKACRTKLPNFAALHQKRFDRMESLDECQERKAKRAKQLLTPTGATDMLQRISPKENTKEPPKAAPNKPITPSKTPRTLMSLNPGYTRFGFKLNMDVNPFSIPSNDAKPELKREPTLPSLAGTTLVRKEVAKRMVMREKSSTSLMGKHDVIRTENRNHIKGVRTNRRFDLQMKMRNIVG